MKRDFSPDQNTRSAATLQTVWAIMGCSALFVLMAYASDPVGWNDPGWWATQGAVLASQVTTNSGVVTTNYVANNSSVASQGQLKKFTQAAVSELNTDLAGSGGASPALSNLVYGWHQDYLTNGYATNTANPTRPYKGSDLQAVNVGQLKSIAQLSSNG